MSATIDTQMFHQYFNNCPIVEVEGRSYPVQGTIFLALDRSDRSGNPQYFPASKSLHGNCYNQKGLTRYCVDCDKDIR